MKRTVLLVLSVMLLPLYVFSQDFYFGGPARLMALGGISFAVPDISNFSDGYSYGFTSAIFTRPQANIISITPFASVIAWDEPDGGTREFRMADWNLSVVNLKLNFEKLGITYWFGQDSVVVVKPYTGFNGKDGFGGLSAEFAYKFMERFSAGLAAGYYLYQSTDTEQVLDQQFYQASFSLLPETQEGWTYSISAGNKSDLSFPAFNSQKIIRLDASASMKSNRDMELYFSLGSGYGSMGYALQFPDEWNWWEVMVFKYEKFSAYGGLDYNANISMKKVLGPVELGIRANGVYSGSYNRSVNTIAGIVTRISDQLIVPFEAGYWGVFKDRDYNKQGYDLTSHGYSARLGVELFLFPELALRTGVDYSGQIEGYTNIVPDLLGLVPETTGMPGSAGNPIYTWLGLNIGAGYKFNAAEVNLAVRYVRNGRIPDNGFGGEYKYGVITVMSDVKIYF